MQEGKILNEEQKKMKLKTPVLVLLIIAAVGICLLIGTIVWQQVIFPAIDKKQYTLEYPTLIQKYSKQYDLDPYLVASIIHVESGNRQDAESSVGAIGLMQIMPTTGEWIAGKLKIENFTTEKLKDPELNIQMGCWYLNFLKERFDSTDTVIAAYNAGHGRIQKWLDDPNHSANQEDLVDIPYPETENYVQKVNQAYQKYKQYYPNAFTS